jgi:hypothetical protein
MRCWVNGCGLQGAWTGASSQYRAQDRFDLGDHRSVTGWRHVARAQVVPSPVVLDDVVMAVAQARIEQAGTATHV